MKSLLISTTYPGRTHCRSDNVVRNELTVTKIEAYELGKGHWTTLNFAGVVLGTWKWHQTIFKTEI